MHIAKQVSDEWRTLGPEDRGEWKELARQDKVRYTTQKEEYEGPWKMVANKRKPKDPKSPKKSPKKPVPAYFAFSNSRRQQIKNENPASSNADISKILSRMWQAAPDDVRQCGLHAVEMAAWSTKRQEEKNKNTPPEKHPKRQLGVTENQETESDDNRKKPPPTSLNNETTFGRGTQNTAFEESFHQEHFSGTTSAKPLQIPLLMLNPPTVAANQAALALGQSQPRSQHATSQELLLLRALELSNTNIPSPSTTTTLSASQVAILLQYHVQQQREHIIGRLPLQGLPSQNFVGLTPPAPLPIMGLEGRLSSSITNNVLPEAQLESAAIQALLGALIHMSQSRNIHEATNQLQSQLAGLLYMFLQGGFRKNRLETHTDTMRLETHTDTMLSKLIEMSSFKKDGEISYLP